MAYTQGLASQWIWNLFSAVLLLLALTPRIYAGTLAISYCSSDNTAGDFQAVFNTWQSNGACRDTCKGSYAFAVLQGSNCWCSNYIPADQTSTYDCSTTCPGWKEDWCGNTQTGLYGYFQLSGVEPSGTAGGSSPTSSSNPSPSPSPSSISASAPPPPSVSKTLSDSGPSLPAPSTSLGGSSSLTMIATVQKTRTSISTVESTSTVPVVVSESVTSSTSSASSSSTSQAPSTTTIAPTEVYTSVTTVTGQVKTILISPTPSDSTLGSSSSLPSNNGGGGISTGKVVGIVVGVALGLGLLIGLGVWFWLRKRHQRNLEAAVYDDASSRGNTGIPSRQVSQMSSAGLLSKTPRILTSGLPQSNNPRSADTAGSALDRRSLATDQRLNPYAIYAHDESRHSNVSLQDNQDYSRQLRVANPDP